MFELEKKFRFEAGHSLIHHDGKCRDPHGHSYVLVIRLRSEQLIRTGPKTNMVIDFGDIKKVVKQMIEDSLDHKWLNDTLNTDSPTAEYIAQWIYNHLKPSLPSLHSISLNETESSKATYYG